MSRSVSLLLLVSLAMLVPSSARADHHLEGEAAGDDVKVVVDADGDVVTEVDEEGLDHEAYGDGGMHHGEGEHHEGAHSGGSPLAYKPDLAIFSLIIFLLFLAALWKICWQPLMDGLNTRESNIRGAVDAANTARDEAAALLAEHKKKMSGVEAEVKEIIAEARRDAETTKADIVAKATEEADALRERSLVDIERAKQQALVELASREQDLVVSATEQVLGRTIDDNDRQRLVDEALGQFASRN